MQSSSVVLKTAICSADTEMYAVRVNQKRKVGSRKTKNDDLTVAEKLRGAKEWLGSQVIILCGFDIRTYPFQTHVVIIVDIVDVDGSFESSSFLSVEAFWHKVDTW